VSTKQRSLSILYNIPNGDQFVRVCAQTFRSIFQIGEKRIKNIANYLKYNNNVRPENRGGKRINQLYEEWRELVKNHISKFRCKPGHYSRIDSNNRRYLSANLSIAKMHRLFTAENPRLELNYKFYYNVFVSQFNLSFGPPRKDICSFCVKQRSIIRIETDEEKKKRQICELILHKYRAKRFYQLLNEVSEESVTICFDLMQNQELPRSCITEAYYLRQL